ncbi:MAG: aquaporin, partial [Acidimicrobiia bacterium]
FNPAVTIGFLPGHGADRRRAGLYIIAQVTGGVVGTVLAHLSFSQSIGLSSSVRSGLGLWTSELVATAVLVGIILLLVRLDRGSHVPAAVGAWVAAAIVATASTGFANPAVTVARAVADSYTGIAPASVPMFLVAQLAGAFVAVMFVRSVVRQEGVHT